MESFETKREEVQEQFERAKEVARHPWQNAEQALAHQRPDGVIGEWKHVPVEEQNVFQRIADRTNGIITPGNLVTTLGAACTIKGILEYRNGRSVRATAYLFAGRFGGDLGDGLAASVTGTRGAPGALYDASVDKLLTAAFVASAVEQGDISKSEALTHGLQQARSARENTRLKFAGGEPNPGRFGKWGQAFLWLEAGGIVLRNALTELGHTRAAELIDGGTEVAKHGAIILNERAADGYERARVDQIAKRLPSQAKQ